MTTLPQTAPMRLPRSVGPSPMLVPGTMMPGGMAPGVTPYGGQQASGGLSSGDVWRVLRANLWLIVIMVMASAIVGYVVNQYLARNHSRYTAVGLMEVRSEEQIPVPGRP